MNQKLLLIDGHSILNRAFYGLPDLTNQEGLHTNAVYGFLTILFKIMGEENPDYMAVAFDRKEPTFRHEMYGEYKGTRKAMPEELREQVPLMKEVLNAMGVVTLERPGYEADDILGTLSRIGEKAGLKVSILSGDRDLLQLATKMVKVRIPKTKKTGTEIEDYDEQAVKDYYQVSPLEFIDLKALMGDSSDNIPGVPGIGEKTATKIIAAYHSIENAYDHVDEITPARAQNAIREHFDSAKLSKTLATIKLDCQLDFTLEQSKLGQIYTSEAYQMFKRLGFRNLLSKFQQEDKQSQQTMIVKEVSLEAEGLFTELIQAEKVGIGIVRDQSVITSAAFCIEDSLVLLVHTDSQEKRDKLKTLLEAVLCGQHKVSLYQLKQYLKSLSVEKERFYLDCQVAAYLLNPLNNSYEYEQLSQEYLDKILPEASELKDSKMVACYQAYTSFQLYETLIEHLIEEEMEELYRTIELPLIFVLDEMEQAGILVKAEELRNYGNQLTGRIQELETFIWEQAGENFNINSPKQLGVILFEKLNLPNGKKTKTGYSTAADVLEKLAVDYPIVQQIMEYRQLTKLKSTYADGLAAYIETDGKIHSNFNQTITATGRISSNEPNLQNIPIRMELGRMIRKVFVPKEGYLFVDADYSQIELRVLAHMSGDEALIHAYSQAEDIHRMTASQVFHVPFEEVTDLQRRNAKAVNFGIVYGISSFGLSQDLSISRKEAAEYIERYFETYPDIKQFLNSLVTDAKEKGYTKTLYNRRRPIPELSSSNFMQRSFGERIAMNSPIQGTAADIIKIAMIRVNQRLKSEGLDARLILQVHDELLIEAKMDQEEQVRKVLEEEMTGAAHLKVKLEVDVHTGSDWYEAK